MCFSFYILSYQTLALARVEKAARELIGLQDGIYIKRARFQLSTLTFCNKGKVCTSTFYENKNKK